MSDLIKALRERLVQNNISSTLEAMLKVVEAADKSLYSTAEMQIALRELREIVGKHE